jgi:hypothetical protein
MQAGRFRVLWTPMTFGGPSETRRVVTLVLRLWRAAPEEGPSTALRLQATHVQSGDVAYFRTIEGMHQHIERLMQRLTTGAASQMPIDLFSRSPRED